MACAHVCKTHAQLSAVTWEMRVSITLISFRISPNIKELLQISSKTSPKTWSLLNSSGSQTHIFWSSWRKREPPCFRTTSFSVLISFSRGAFCRLGSQPPGAQALRWPDFIYSLATCESRERTVPLPPQCFQGPSLSTGPPAQSSHQGLVISYVDSLLHLHASNTRSPTKYRSQLSAVCPMMPNLLLQMERLLRRLYLHPQLSPHPPFAFFRDNSGKPCLSCFCCPRGISFSVAATAFHYESTSKAPVSKLLLLHLNVTIWASQVAQHFHLQFRRLRFNP